MKKLRVLCSILFVFFFAPWHVSCKKAEQSAAIAYSLDLEYDEKNRVLSGTETVIFENRTAAVFDFLKFNLYPNAFREDAAYRAVSAQNEERAFYAGKSYGGIEVTNVTVGNAKNENNVLPDRKTWEIEGEDCNILRVTLNEPLCENESVSVKISFAATLPLINHRFGVSETAVNLGNFFPILCGVTSVGNRNEDGTFYENVYYSDGDPFVSDCADFFVAFTFPERFRAASSGEETERTSSGEKRTCSYRLKNARDFALCLSEAFHETETTVRIGKNDVAVKYYYVKDPLPQKTLETAEKALRYYSEAYGEYPYTTYSLAETGFFQGGMEYPALCFISDSLTESERDYVVAHETAHQWWYAAVGSNQAEEAWQDEGLAEFSAACFFGEHEEYKTTKEDLLQAAEKEYHAYYKVYSKVFGEADTRMSRSLKDYVSDYEYRAIAYDKGLILFSALEKSVGKKTVHKALKIYFADNKYKIAAPADLVAAFEKAGVDVSGYFASFLDGTAIV